MERGKSSSNKSFIISFFFWLWSFAFLFKCSSPSLCVIIIFSSWRFTLNNTRHTQSQMISLMYENWKQILFEWLVVGCFHRLTEWLTFDCHQGFKHGSQLWNECRYGSTLPTALFVIDPTIGHRPDCWLTIVGSMTSRHMGHAIGSGACRSMKRSPNERHRSCVVHLL